MDSIFKQVGAHVEGLSQQVGASIESAFGGANKQDVHSNTEADPHSATQGANRFGSFAPEVSGNCKWYVDGASYFWAVSEALESKSSMLRLQKQVFHVSTPETRPEIC